jgi:hypothetical protein
MPGHQDSPRINHTIMFIPVAEAWQGARRVRSMMRASFLHVLRAKISHRQLLHLTAGKCHGNRGNGEIQRPSGVLDCDDPTSEPDVLFGQRLPLKGVWRCS